MRDKNFNKLVQLLETMNTTPAMGEAPARAPAPAPAAGASVQAYASKINDIFKAIEALSNDPNFQKLYAQVRNKNQLNVSKYEAYIGDFYSNLAEYSRGSSEG